MTETTVAAAIAGDESAFAAPTERHRRELHEDGVIAEITTFGAGLFPAFGLPPTLTRALNVPL